MNHVCKFRLAIIFAVTVACLPFATSVLHGQAYIFAQGGTEDRITHASGYDGTGGEAFVTVGIDPTSANALAMRISVENRSANLGSTFTYFGQPTDGLCRYSHRRV